MRPLTVLGVTGSIGRQTLEVADHLGVEVAAIAANRASDELLAVAAARPSVDVVVAGVDDDERFAVDLGSRVRFGADALVELAAEPGRTVVNGIVGSAGLAPSVAALQSGNRLALANKESLVSGGPVVDEALRTGGGELIPVDSEHSALWQCLRGEHLEWVERLVLTASGGPFRGRSAEELTDVTVEQALDHPTWSMGPRITIDSATLVNKAFEVIEAHHLFGISYDRIDVVVHPQSIVHSVVEFVDGSQKAQLGDPDMRMPIQLAITAPDRVPAGLSRYELAGRTLTFEAPDREAFPALDLGYAAGRDGGSAPAVFNAADEVAVAAFLEKRIGFADIPRVLELTLDTIPVRDVTSVDDVYDVDAEARSVAEKVVSRVGASA
jgi:1-deoxy-D-xylulose-5-phosphate reductoisomerase